MRQAHSFTQRVETTNEIKWRDAFRHLPSFTAQFQGRHHVETAAKLIMQLQVWAKPQLLLDHSILAKTFHPWICVVRGHHGAGKSALVSFLLSTLLNVPNWQEYDFSDSTQTNLAHKLYSIASQKPDERDQLDIHVIENAEMITNKQSIAEISHLVQQASQRILAQDGSPFPSRIIIITAHLAPQWIRTLVEAKATLITLSPYLSVSDVNLIKPSWKHCLSLCEGSPGKAILMDYANVDRSSTQLMSAQS
jgi:hypothetical protein